MRALAILVALSLLSLVAPTPAVAADRERWHTRVFAMVEEPGFPAYAFAHRNGRVYAGTYTNPEGDTTASLVREWRADGTLQRTWSVPGQDLSVAHGVQVANADRRGRLVLLEKSKARVMTLSTRSGRFRTWAKLPDLPDVEGAPIPNYATWGPRGALFVTDYGQAVIWKIPRRTREPKPWFSSPALQGAAGFGTTGHRLPTRPARAADHPADRRRRVRRAHQRRALPTAGQALREARTAHDAVDLAAGDLPDGFGIGRRTGRIYLANAGSSNQLVVLSPTARSSNASRPCPGPARTARGSRSTRPPTRRSSADRLMVANQSFSGNTDHHAILDVFVGERGARRTCRGGRSGGTGGLDR